MGIYRAYRTDLFYELDLHLEESYVTEKALGTVIGCEPLLSVRAAKQRLKVTEIPGDEPARLAGIRKLQAFRWGGAYLLQVFRETYFWKKARLGEKEPVAFSEGVTETGEAISLSAKSK
jgi:hypothetical protein